MREITGGDYEFLKIRSEPTQRCGRSSRRTVFNMFHQGRKIGPTEVVSRLNAMNEELKDIRKENEELKEAGVQVVANISVDPMEIEEVSEKINELEKQLNSQIKKTEAWKKRHEAVSRRLRDVRRAAAGPRCYPRRY